ncbi:hypothetical protein ACHHYP_00179 [Achlya hypogyna]|uniref:Uncharacterized protein n=1 Tax=Achlya hypogyna TaxID=1202772 RepID=A0A1V9ZB80_ACHHY|nr:hypothetical protein ACHHYP_00179 [Achlya hypogyna]
MSFDGPVTATLRFYSHTTDGDEPFSRFGGKRGDSLPATNVVSAPSIVALQDMRNNEELFSIDEQGFEAIRGVPSLRCELTDAQGNLCTDGKEGYVKQHVEALVKARFESLTFVDVFKVTFRSADPNDSLKGQRRPSPLVHIDQTTETAAVFTAQLPNVVRAKVVTGEWRLRILSVWQPLVANVEDWPLALAESASCPTSRLLTCETRFPGGTSGAMALVRLADIDTMSWWYWSGMQDDEVLVINNFDSQNSCRCPHTSFRDPRVPSNATAYRKSAEARVLLVTSD